MTNDDHKRGTRKGQFCAVAGTPCEDGENFVDNCGLESFSGFAFRRLVKAVTGKFTFAKQFEAHHVLCVSSVNNTLITSDVFNIVREANWCINRKPNMFAMPLWGHTVKHYCTITAADGWIESQLAAPSFENIPMHDYDQNCKLGYTHEVEEDLRYMVDKIEEAGHKAESLDLAGVLDRKSAKFKERLHERGRRNGGTHAGWITGMKSPTSSWYVPFSMASTGALTQKGFPVRRFDERLKKWITRITEALQH